MGNRSSGLPRLSIFVWMSEAVVLIDFTVTASSLFFSAAASFMGLPWMMLFVPAPDQPRPLCGRGLDRGRAAYRMMHRILSEAALQSHTGESPMSREIAPGFVEERDPRTGEVYLQVPVLGELLIDFPMFNKGTAFTQQERDALGLQGILPPRVVTMEQQVARVVDNYARKTTELERYIHLISLLDRNETLFYRVLVDRLEELLPIIYTPTVGLACQQFARIFRRSRGIYLTPEDTGRVGEILSHWPF